VTAVEKSSLALLPDVQRATLTFVHEIVVLPLNLQRGSATDCPFAGFVPALAFITARSTNKLSSVALLLTGR
jgi:hypothetical protein